MVDTSLNEIKISIIMGIYNCAKTLPVAIESILEQTCQSWKLIMCDDGSKDDTYAVAERYQLQYPDKIVLIKNEKNMGLNYTLNHCLQYADTEYIARMDGDDISLPTRLEKELRFLEENPQYAIVSTPMIYFDEEGDFRIGKGGGEPSVKKMVTGTPFCHAPCMVRKVAYDAVEGYAVDEKLLRVEDWDLWIRMYEKGYKGYVLEEPLYKMCDDRNATARRKFKYRFNEMCVSASVVKRLKLPFWHYVRTLRPIIVGLLPGPLYLWLHKRKK
ncbi:MAG: glycosyltransferase [Clostridia bacterium]|nr:glycosyltransferase [Clostridia bacterium]